VSVELIAVGSELLRFGRVDTNGTWLVEQLARLGLEVLVRNIVDDDEPRVAALVRSAMARSPVVILTGGLGPTDDDRTRESLALAFDRPLEHDPAQLQVIHDRFASVGRSAGPEQAKQADRPRGTAWIDNPLGSAPGLLFEGDGTLVAALPGVPAEMRRMFLDALAPRLARADAPALVRRTLKISGRSESGVDRRVQDLYGTANMAITILSGTGGVELHLRAEAPDLDQARRELQALEIQIRERLGDDVFGVDDDSLASIVGQALTQSGRTLATAESCTAGLLGGEITRIPGASNWYRGGLVVYHDQAKQALAGISPEMLATHGAVSEPVARALAQAARERLGADIGVGITGIAGPGGGSEGKPVGLVHLALAAEGGVDHRELRLPGDREDIRQRAVMVALDRIWRMARG